MFGKRVDDATIACVVAFGVLTFWLVGNPPVSGNPQLVRSWAHEASVSAHTAVEALLLIRDPKGALKRFEAVSFAETQTPRWLRLEADIRAALGDDRVALRRLDALAQHPEWVGPAETKRQWIRHRALRTEVLRIGLALFAFSLAGLGWVGARELLRISQETLVFAGVVVGSAMMARQGSPVLGLMFSLWGGAMALMVHAAFAAVRRIRPGIRGRLLLAVLVLLGSSGVFGAQAAQLGPLRVLGAFAVRFG